MTDDMEHARLGNTGLKVSRLALGCMSYGDPTTPGAHEWSLVDDEAQPFFEQAIELGITFWDTANVYQAGTSEEVVGRAIKRYSRREDIVLATKVFGRMHDGPGGQGLSRKAIMEQIDASLTRLGTDYVDLYQIHRFDPESPVEETMEALHDVVKAGKVRYIGASSMYAWQFAKLQHAADLGGWTRFVSMQNQYNLLRRQDERELMAMCGDMGVGPQVVVQVDPGLLAPELRVEARSCRCRSAFERLRILADDSGDRREVVAGARQDRVEQHVLDRERALGPDAGLVVPALAVALDEIGVAVVLGVRWPLRGVDDFGVDALVVGDLLGRRRDAPERLVPER